MNKLDKNICMCCGKLSKNRFKYRVLTKENEYRDFCSTECLIMYFSAVKLQEGKQ